MRLQMATFGIPWAAPRTLSVSFPSDSAQVGGYDNSLRTVLDQVADRKAWQEAALRAFQTWAVFGNINVGLVPDRGDDFGTVGLATDDPRFGEFRLGAFPQPGVLANALPFQQLAGTWSGDVLLNTQTNFFLWDWSSKGAVQVPQPNSKGPAIELFSVLLHEAGNALGIADNNLPGTVMNGNYEGPKGSLTATDISAIRRLYGSRQDVFEPVSNNTRGTASRIVAAPRHSLAEPIVYHGSLNTLSDVDFYRFTPIAGQEKVTVRLWASGISLLKSKLEVFDRFGVKLADVKADSIFENNLQIEIGSLKDHRELFVRVARHSSDVFGIGDYRLELDYRPSNLQPDIKPPLYDEDDDDSKVLDFVSVDQLFAQAGLIDREHGANDTLATAVALQTPLGFLPQTRYQISSALSNASDRDFFSFQAPTDSRVAYVDASPVGLENPDLDIVVMNSSGDRVASFFRQKSGGGGSLEIAQPVAGQVYVLGIRTKTGSAFASGNYVVSIDFGTDIAATKPLISGSVSFGQDTTTGLRVNKTQLFRFDLLAQSGSLNDGVQITIYDARTKQIMLEISSASQSAAKDYVWLSKGEYIIRASKRSRAGRTLDPIDFVLSADGISDDQGPNPIDPTMPPQPPTEVETEIFPFNGLDIIDYPIPTFEDPWFDEYELGFVDDFYPTFV